MNHAFVVDVADVMTYIPRLVCCTLDACCDVMPDNTDFVSKMVENTTSKWDDSYFEAKRKVLLVHHTEHRVQSAECRVQSVECRMKSAG